MPPEKAYLCYKGVETLKICVLKESLCIGGTERGAANISKVLEKDHDVTLALYDGADIKYSYGGKIVDFDLPPKKSLLGKVVNTLHRDIKLRKLIKREKFDIMYTFTVIGNRQTRFKYPNTIKLISARDFAKMRDVPWDYHHALNNSDAMICNSEYTKQYYLFRYPEHANKVYTLYNCLDLDEINRQAKEEVPSQFLSFTEQHKKTIVAVGRFCEVKGFEYLIEAFAQAREKTEDLGLVLVGDGRCKKKYENVIQRLGIEDHVFFTGNQKNPYKYMARCNCFVMPSLNEGFPNVLAEALALGLPVIATNCYSGPAEILRTDGDYEAVTDQYATCDFGIITPRFTDNDNTQAIAQLSMAICALIEDTDKMQYYKVAALKRAADFSMEAARKKLNRIFDELVERRSKPNLGQKPD
jgi:glycosyltransferase involved in cell wall biosynthesis